MLVRSLMFLTCQQGFEYSRSGNPNRNSLESTLAALESGGAYALAFASGSSTTATVLQSLPPKSHIISVNDVYGGTFRYMTRVAAENQGIETSFLDLESMDDEAIYSAIRDNTKVSCRVYISYLLLSKFPACMDRISDKPDVKADRYRPDSVHYAFSSCESSRPC